MMTSVGANRARGNWEPTQTQSQTQHKQRPQATAEQIRLAQMISDHNDTDFEEKVKQLIDITGKNQDECVIALHDCNGDVNRAINVLLEGNPDTHSWEMVGKKKTVSGQKDGGPAETCEEAKENRERDQDFSRRRGGPLRRVRGGSRGREFRGQENGLDYGKSGGPSGRGTERGRRGRGRGRGGSGRRGRFSAQGMGIFNPADYAEPSIMDENYGCNSNWNNIGSMEPDDGTRLDFIEGQGSNYPRNFDTAPGMMHPGAWRTATEEWGTEDWNEDLSETKIFTASSVSSAPLPTENVTITAGQRIDLAVLLGKPPAALENDTANLDSSQNTSISQPLVFSNSKQSAITQQTSPSSFSHHNMVSMLGKGFSDVGEAKGGSTTGSQFLEQFKTAQVYAQLAAQHAHTGGGSSASSWELGPAPQSSTLVQYNLKSPSESTIHSPFTKRQSFTPASSMMEVFLQDKQSLVSAASTVPASPASPLPNKPSMVPQMSPVSSDNQSSSPQPAQQKLRQQKKKASLTSKIPALAVEMPGSSDISGLNLQFGVLQFGSEPVLQEYELLQAKITPASQSQGSLYTSSSSESSSMISSNPSQEVGYQSTNLQTSTYTSQSSAQVPLYEQRSTQTRRFPNSASSSPQKDLTQANNGFCSAPSTQLQSPPPLESVAAPSAVISESTATQSLTPVNDTLTSPTLLTTVGQHSTTHSLSHNEERPANSQQNSTASTHPNSLSSSTSGRTSAGSLLHTAVESDVNLHSPASTFSTASTTVPVPAPPPAANSSASLSNVGSMGIGLNSNSTVTASARSGVSTTSGKAPPNLPPGVPPLLPNPYIMAPGLLHPYPPQVYGYEDLQMLQTRFPLDYYSIPFPTPNTQMAGRDGSLTQNPYSGDLSKFGRGDASSPAPATTLAQPQQSPSQAHHTAQQTFMNPALPPGYSYASMPYYTGVPGLPSTFQYGPAMFPVPPTSSKHHGVNVGVNASAAAFQQAGAYSSHAYNTGYDDLSQVRNTGDFCKGGYSGAASAQTKPPAATGPGAGVSVTSSNTGVPDISGSVYSKTQQSFEKQGFHTGTPAASFSLPSALGSAGPINAAAAAGYPPTPFMHILTPHQQPHSQILHHHLQQDGQSSADWNAGS
ncbi:ubiquitin-associated protein 2-like isoform X3 [Ambystoma mexicanum]|uniref:ubiquitin-associated protein 2-like isoform X3 n=1 Tax=Ambystoma mexicanum TaxID=8296 RepID=UPI0037E98727